MAILVLVWKVFVIIEPYVVWGQLYFWSASVVIDILIWLSVIDFLSS